MEYVRPATIDDLNYLAPRLREADVEEIKAACGIEPWAALLLEYDLSEEKITMVGEQGEAVGIYGITPVTRLDALVWLHATEDLKNYPFQFLRRCRAEVNRLNQKYPVLWNFVDARNELHINWLRWCGFTFIKRHEEHGVQKKPFYEFVRIGHV